ncbi:hypothetical protein SEVIR_5G154801v4 [Setaria viridis]
MMNQAKRNEFGSNMTNRNKSKANQPASPPSKGVPPRAVGQRGQQQASRQELDGEITVKGLKFFSAIVVIQFFLPAPAQFDRKTSPPISSPSSRHRSYPPAHHTITTRPTPQTTSRPKKSTQAPSPTLSCSAGRRQHPHDLKPCGVRGDSL